MSENSTPAPRDVLMTALSVAEHVLTTAPGEPFDVEIRHDEVRAFYYQQPEAVAEFAKAFELKLTLRTEHGGKPIPHLEARGKVLGFVVSAWALGEEDQQERYAACMPAVGLPEEWRTAGAA